MANSFQRCIEKIFTALRGKVSKAEITDAVNELMSRADNAEGSANDRLNEARDRLLADYTEAGLLAKRNHYLDSMKDLNRRRFYMSAPDPVLGLEAKLVGVNTPFKGSRDSAELLYRSRAEKWMAGLVHDLERAGLDKLFASRTLERDWARELFEINKGVLGKPGISKNAQALAIAKTLHNWQKLSIADINMAGGSIKSYSGYVTRTSHNPDTIRLAHGQSGKGGTLADRDQWIADTLPLLNVQRTFNTGNPHVVKEVMGKVWTALKSGEHFDLSSAQDRPSINVASQLSAHRELHFKDAESWLTYNEKYGVSNPTATVVHAFDAAARRLALLEKFGSKPRDAFEEDLLFLKNQYKGTEHYDKLKAAEQGLRNRYNQLDFSNNQPANKLFSQLASNWMALQAMAKLVRVPFTHIASLPTKAAALRYLGVPLANRYASIFSGLIRGAQGSERRAVAELLYTGAQSRIGHILSRHNVTGYDGASAALVDGGKGLMSRSQSLFFKLTGISALTDNERADAEAVMSRHYGMQRGLSWNELGDKEQRGLTLYGIEAPEWNAINKAEWDKFGERTYLTPKAASRLSDEDVRTYLEEANATQGRPRLPVNDEMIAKARADLADTIHAFYYDQGRYAIFEPGARTRAMVFQGTAQSSPNLYLALRLLAQFKLWPAEMVTRTWGRMIYGGDSGMEKLGGVLELAVGSIIFGTLAEGLRELVQMQDPITRMEKHPAQYIMRGFLRSGAATIMGDYLLGEYDRHGYSALGSLAGPTFSQIEDVLDLIHGGGPDNAHPWRTRAADALGLIKHNAPFLDMWWTFKAFDYLVFYRLQEAINPGYLKRMEKRMKDKQGIDFMLKPSAVAGGR